MTDIRKLLGSNIRNCRTDLGISQEQLAEKVGMAANYLGLLENGKKFPSVGMLERIARVLGKDTTDLLVLTPVQQDWKAAILTKIDTVINDELKSLNCKT